MVPEGEEEPERGGGGAGGGGGGGHRGGVTPPTAHLESCRISGSGGQGGLPSPLTSPAPGSVLLRWEFALFEKVARKAKQQTTMRVTLIASRGSRANQTIHHRALGAKPTPSFVHADVFFFVAYAAIT